MPYSVSVVICYAGNSSAPELIGLAANEEAVHKVVKNYIKEQQALFKELINVFEEPDGADHERDAEACIQMREFHDRLERMPIRYKPTKYCDHFYVDKVDLIE